MQNQLGINWTGSKPYHELLADCFAGMYFRYGIWTSTWLNNYNDLAEARNQIRVLGAHRHGAAQRRLNAFNYGLTQTKWWGCPAAQASTTKSASQQSRNGAPDGALLYLSPP